MMNLQSVLLYTYRKTTTIGRRILAVATRGTLAAVVLVGALSLTLSCGGGGGGGSNTPAPTPAPVIISFVAAKSPITAGTSTTLPAPKRPSMVPRFQSTFTINSLTRQVPPFTGTIPALADGPVGRGSFEPKLDASPSLWLAPWSGFHPVRPFRIHKEDRPCCVNCSLCFCSQV
jgi:hypothetical protein